MSHLAKDLYAGELAAFARGWNEQATEKVVLRGRAEVSQFFDGLDLVEPGVVQISNWRPAPKWRPSHPSRCGARSRASRRIVRNL